MKEEGFSIRSISSATGYSRQKITTVLEVAKEKDVDMKTVKNVSDKWLEEFLYPEKAVEESSYRAIDFEYIHKVYLAIGNCVKRQLILYATCHHYLLMN
jgi:hypothetical protein